MQACPSGQLRPPPHSASTGGSEQAQQKATTVHKCFFIEKFIADSPSEMLVEEKKPLYPLAQEVI